MKLVVNATLQALVKLHAAHLVHRDLRLDNIFEEVRIRTLLG